MYGGRFIRVGGPVDGASPDEKTKPRTDDTIEPAVFHPLPEEVYDEMCHAADLKATGGGVIDLTAGSGKFAIMCLKKGIPYVGITLTDAHAKLLEDHLVQYVCTAMTTPGDALYDPTVEKVNDPEEHAGEGKPKPKPGRPKKNDKKEGKKPKPKTDSSNSTDDSSQDDDK